MSDNNTTFRTAAEPVETAAPIKPEPDTPKVSDTHAPELVATYSSDMGKPYVAKYLEIEQFADEPEFKRDLSEIEGFIKERVEKKQLDNSTRAAEAYLKDLERKAGLSRYESTNKRITRLLAYIDFVRKVES